MAKKKKQEIEIVLIGGNKEQFEYLKQLLADLDSHLYHVLWSASYKGGVAYARENQPDLFLVNYEPMIRAGWSSSRQSGAGTA